MSGDFVDLSRGVDLNQIRIFLAVVSAGSFTKAGHRLEMSQSAVSRQLSSLESSLKVSLLQRSAQGIRLTEAGEVLVSSASEMLERFSYGLARIEEFKGDARGPLKISTAVVFGSSWLTSKIVRLRELYPDISIMLLLSDNIEVNLQSRQADMAIRFISPHQNDFIQRYLMKIRFRVFASRQYLDRFGAPETAQDLDHHHIIAYGGDLPTHAKTLDWLLDIGRKHSGRRVPVLQASSNYAIYRAVQSGLGIGALPFFVRQNSDNLVEILSDLEGPHLDAYIVYSADNKYSRRVSAVAEYLIAEAKVDCG